MPPLKRIFDQHTIAFKSFCLTWIGFSELLVATSASVSTSLPVAVPPISSHPKVGMMFILVSATTSSSSSITVTALSSSMVISITT